MEMEDNKSEIGSQRSFGRRINVLENRLNPYKDSSLRGKLVDIHNLDQDYMDQIVDSLGRIGTLFNISKLSKSTIVAIEQVEFVDPSRDNKVATKLQVGNVMYEHCVNMIVQCGEALVMAVKHYVDVTNEIDKFSVQKGALINATLEKRQNLTMVHCPDMAVIEACIEIGVGKQYTSLQECFYSMVNARVIAPTTRTRSTSRGVTEESTEGTLWTPTSTAEESWETGPQIAKVSCEYLGRMSTECKHALRPDSRKGGGAGHS